MEKLMDKMIIEKLDEKLEKLKKCAWEHNCLTCLTLAMQVERYMEQRFSDEELLCLYEDK
jgi:hypothetical protein